MIVDSKYRSIVVYNDKANIIRYVDWVLYGLDYMLTRILGFVVKGVKTQELRDIVDDIVYITSVTEEEVEYIKSYMRAFVKGLRFMPI